jgi:hypothetical protein
VHVRITGSAEEVSKAVNDFSADYHDDFARVRKLARVYNAEGSPPDEGNVSELSRKLRCVLGNWGAGRREAPKMVSLEEFAKVLREPNLYAALQLLANKPLSTLGTIQGRRSFQGRPASED